MGRTAFLMWAKKQLSCNRPASPAAPPGLRGAPRPLSALRRDKNPGRRDAYAKP